MESVLPPLIILLSQIGFCNKCCSGGVTHSVDNTSNHSVINMSLEIVTFVPHNVECDKMVPGIKPVCMI